MYGDKALGCDHSSLCYTAEYVPLCCDLCQNAYTGIAGKRFINIFISINKHLLIGSYAYPPPLILNNY